MATQTKLMTPKTIVQLVLVLVVMPLLPMIISGAWGWWEAWAYAILSFLGFIISRALASRRHADLLVERTRSMGMQDAKTWDRILAPAMALGSVIPLVVAGMDKLFGWTQPFELNLKIVSLVVVILGYALGSWALIENRFFFGRCPHSNGSWTSCCHHRTVSLRPPPGICWCVLDLSCHPRSFGFTLGAHPYRFADRCSGS